MKKKFKRNLLKNALCTINVKKNKKPRWKFISKNIANISKLISNSSCRLLTREDNVSVPVLSSSASIIRCPNPQTGSK